MALEDEVYSIYCLSKTEDDLKILSLPFCEWDENDARNDYALAMAPPAVCTVTFFRQEAMRRIMQLIKDNLIYAATSHSRYFKEMTQLIKNEPSNDRRA